MASMNILIVGGSGFIGSAVAERLMEEGAALTIPTRRLERARHLAVLPRADVVEADVHDPAALDRLLQGQDAVVNLAGVLHSSPGRPYGPAFARAHVELPAKLVAACERAGVGRLVHISALGADAAGPSEYQRSKAAGEAAIRAGGGLQWFILRPSVVFGRGDHFLNLFAKLVGAFPVLPLAGAHCRFQPVWVEDVAEVVARCLADPGPGGQTLTVAGPSVYTLGELVRYVSRLTGHRRLVVPLPEGLAMLQARLLELAPQPMMSRDNVRSMRVDNVAAGGAPLPFGLVPRALEAVAPLYLGHAAPRQLFDDYRRHKHHKAGARPVHQ